jgi:YbdK family carboxylate-amine ligase
VRVQIPFHSSPSSSLGIEWELQLVDRRTRELTSGAAEILRELAPAGEHATAKHELLQSTVEVITGVCSTVGEATADLATTIALVSPLAAARGLGLMCAGTHPVTDWRTQQISDNPRYAKLVEDMQWLARRLQIFGVHVHVGVRSSDKAMAMVNALSAYIPHLLALTASSPYWKGGDTGLASARSKIFEGLPTAGLPQQLTDWAQFEYRHDRVHQGGLVGHPAAPDLRHGGAADRRRSAHDRRGRHGRRALAVPGRHLRPRDRQGLHPAGPEALGAAREQVAGGALRPFRRHHRG